ncbi:MAG TPA: S41 family peptidase [Polyangiaceae bacterium]|jgi:carboxyl-terminal processing protease
MLPANAMGSGQEIHPTNMMTTPVGVPIVGANLASNAMRAPPCPTILVTSQPALNMGSIAPVTVSVPPMIPPCLPSTHVMGYPTIVLQGLPATQLTSPSMGNGGCAPVGATLVPNVTNVFYGYARSGGAGAAEGRRAWSLEEARALDGSLEGPCVESSLRAGGVGSVRIRRFAPGVPAAFFHAVRALTGEGMTALLVDLRGNGGGAVDAFLQLAGDFLEEGTLVATLVDGDGDGVECRARSSSDYAFPLVLLVDGGTASVAEAFAGCLQAHGRAVLVGERTHGKGDVQAVVVGPDGKSSYATVATIVLPDGRRLQGAGLEPDLPPPQGPGDSRWRALAGRLSPALRDAVCEDPPPSHAERTRS